MASKRFIRQTLKKITVSAFIGVVAFGSLMIIPAAHVSALIPIDNSGAAPLIDSLSPDVQAQIYASMQLLRSGDCVFNTGNNNDFITAEDIANGKWLKNASGGGVTANDGNIGIAVSQTGGTVPCDNGNNWFSNLLNRAGNTELTTMAAQVFHVGVNGNYYVAPGATNKGVLIRLLQSQLFGGAALPATDPPHAVYELLIADFTATGSNNCQAQLAPTSPDAYAKAVAGKSAKVIYFYDTTANKVITQKYIYANYKHYISIGYGTGAAGVSGGQLECQQIAAALANNKASAKGSYAAALAAYILANPGTPASGSTGAGSGSSASDLNLNCGSRASVLLNPLNWLMCPIIESLSGVARGLDNGINDMLQVNVQETFSKTSGSGYYGAWQQMRIYAIIFLVIATLIIVISQALGFEFLDAYTVRKVLPRLLIAAVAISVSWELMTFFVQLTNDLGAGIRAIIFTPFSKILGGDTINLGGGGLFIADLIGVGAIAALGPLGLLSFIATAALAVAVAFFVLVLRQILITLLIVLAPIAIVCYILPNTQKVWKLWWDSFSKGLMMFPIIVAFISVGRVVAVTAASKGGALNSFIAFVAYFAPYLLLPLTFKFAGGLIGNLGGFVNNKGRGAFDGLKNFRGNQMKQRRHNAMERAQTGNIFKGAAPGTRRAALNEHIQGATLIGKAGINPGRMGERIEAARGAATLAHMGQLGEKSDAYKAFAANDTLINASQHGRGTEADIRSYLEGQGQTGDVLSRNVALVRAARRDMGASFDVAAAVANASTGTGYSGEYDADGNLTGGGSGAMVAAISRASGGNAVVSGAALAQAKSRAEQSRRFDLSGAGYGTMLGQMQRIEQAQSEPARQAAILTATETMSDNAIEVNGAGAVLGGRGHSVEMLIPALQRRVTRNMDAVHNSHTALVAAQAGGNQADIVTAQAGVARAQRSMQQTLASNAGLLDVASSVSPENGRTLADGLMNQMITDVNGRQATVGQVIEMNRGNADFNQMRREYQNQAQQQYANAAQQAAQQAAPPQPVPGQP